MCGRAWCLSMVVMVGFAQVAAAREYAFGGPEPVPVVATPTRFAAGGVTGPWTLLEFGVLFGPPSLEDIRLGPSTNLVVGWGFDVGPVQLRPTARFGLSYFVGAVWSPDERWRPTPVGLSLAAANLLDDERHTGLRLTPALGVTIPTRFGEELAWSTISLALQLERRFGPVELAWRAETGKPVLPPPAFCPMPRFCTVNRTPINWTLENSLQGEGWIDPTLSIGLRLGFGVAWNQLLAGAEGVAAQTFADTRLSTSGHVWVSWAFVRLFGLSADLSSEQSVRRVDGSVRVPFFSFEESSTNQVTVSLSIWFRSDVSLARNWVER